MISLEVWICWAIIGIVGGYMCSRLLLGGARTFLMGLIGAGASMLAGWTFMSLLNVDPMEFERWEYVSFLVAAAFAALVLWIAVTFVRRNLPPDEEDDE